MPIFHVRRCQRVVVVAVLFFLLALFGIATAQGDTWTATGSLAEARRDHTATLLKDGKVLFVGGATLRAELYDFGTGTFSTVGSTLFSHGVGATATRLRDGKVLIVGGSLVSFNAEIYDPATGTFRQAGTLNAVHVFHSATLLADGRVLIAGGFSESSSLVVAELYDPLTNTFSLAGDLNENRGDHTATLLPVGRVLFAEGLQITTSGPLSLFAPPNCMIRQLINSV
jgi:hypothetical protein